MAWLLPAVDYLSLLQNSNILANVRVAETILIEFNTKLKQRFTFISNARAIGAIAAWKLNLPPKQIKLVVSLAKRFRKYTYARLAI